MAESRQGLPPKPFFYTLDQVAYLLSVTEDYLKMYLIHYEGRSPGTCPKDRMIAVDISSAEAPAPEWRIQERHLIRWMKLKGYRWYERGYVR